MGGAAGHQRSSSPLKRRASESIDEPLVEIGDDVDMDASALPLSGNTNQEKNYTEGLPSPSSSGEVEEKKSSSVAVEHISSRTSDNESDLVENGPEGVPPSIDQQVQTVMQMVEENNSSPLQENEIAYVISKKWLERVQSRASRANPTNKEALEGELGPIDNSDIIQEILKEADGTPFVRLRPGLGRLEFEYFPAKAWDYVVKLHGIRDGQFPIVRKAINTNPDEQGIPNIEYERDPPIFVIHRLWSAHSPIPLPQILKAQKPSAPFLVFSRNLLYHDFLKFIKSAASIETSTRVRLWKVPHNFGGSKSTSANIPNTVSPPLSRANTPSLESQIPEQDNWTGLLVDVESFLKLEKGTQRMIVQHEDSSPNPTYKGTMTIQMAGLDTDQALIIDEKVENDYLSQFVGKANSVPTSTTRSGITTVKSASESGRASPAQSGPVTRGRTQKSSRTVGTVGLQNLGNTCYMNSALQCVRSVEELTKYFLTGQAAEEVNRDNPLGNNGQVADAYNELLHQMYRDPAQGSVIPRQFKNTIGRIVPSFSGYGQQDSQEFLGFLLDGLQEDLSRIKKKPYIEKPDSTDDMVGNPEAIREMAAKVWDITKKRDDSVIADLFTGMYKSTLVCPLCDKVSITFDPFNNLTLQLPVDNYWTGVVTFLPLNDVPVQISVDIDKNSSIRGLKEFISKRTGVPVAKLFMAEEYKNHFYRFYEDMKPIAEAIQKGDNAVFYELESIPTNWPPPKKPVSKQKARSANSFNHLSFNHFDSNDDDDIPNWDDPIADKMLVPVLHRTVMSTNRIGSHSGREWVLFPYFIIVTLDEARNEEAIKRKVLEKLATLSTSPEFSGEHSDEEELSGDSNGHADPDLVVTSASDADSAGDGKVVASSIDGDDEIVDVTMNGSEKAVGQESEKNGPSLTSLKNFKTERPHWLDPTVYMNPIFQNIFTLSYFGGSTEVVPIGWGTNTDDVKDYPFLSSRNPVVHDTSRDSGQQDDVSIRSGTPSDSEDSSDEDASRLQNNKNAAEDLSSEDELALPQEANRGLPIRPVPHRPGAAHVDRKTFKTYSRKGIKSTTTNRFYDGPADEPEDEGPLLRLGEGLIVDWDPVAYDSLFCGDSGDNLRGSKTFSVNSMELLRDPELEQKRKARQLRKKSGLTLDECLDEFGKEEILSEMDTWYCPRCKEHRRASKKFELWKTPDILIMHLKRFSSSGIRRDKLDIFVDFPIEGLDLTPRVVEREPGKQEIFDLFAIDDHWGGLGGGHYTAFAKSFIDNEWYEYNDSSVQKQRDLSRMVSNGAYLLFYRRRSTVPLGGPRFQEISEQYNKSAMGSEDESSEPGEGQRLVGDSSLYGSSSALTGAEAIRLQNAGHANNHVMQLNTITRDNVTTGSTVTPAELVKPPPYGAEGETSNLLPRDHEMNDIEDEAVDMGPGYSNFPEYNQTAASVMKPTWTFANLNASNMESNGQSPSGANSLNMELNDEIDALSDAAAHDSSASENSMAERLQDFADAEPLEGDYEENFVPDMSEELQAATFDLRENILLHRDGVLQVPADNDSDYIEREADEIRVEDDEGWK